MIKFLKNLGADISLKGRTISILESKTKSLKVTHRDLRQNRTWHLYDIGALLAKNLTIDKIEPKIVKSELSVLKKIGVQIKQKTSIIIKSKN